jgi:hypothetical protein
MDSEAEEGVVFALASIGREELREADEPPGGRLRRRAPALSRLSCVGGH